MSTFSPNDKVICIDSTFSPMNSGITGNDLSFPAGFIDEGEIYCVKSVQTRSDGQPHLTLVGKPVLQHNQEIGWKTQLFRKVAPRKGSVVAQSKQHLLGHPVKTLVHRI